jgi:FkbM family methyltransferase
MANEYSLNKIKHRLFASLYGSATGQHKLERKIKKLQRYLGIGSGGNVRNSGEVGIVKTLEKEKSSDLCIFDVGANKGDFTKLILSHLGKDSEFTIHCFEPSKYTYSLLRQNLAGNQQVILNNIGLGEKQGGFNLYYDEPGSGGASLTKRDLDYMGVEFKHCEHVTIDTIDNYCEEKSIVFIDLLKIDVEGHELDVLKGAVNMLRKKSIGKVSFEFGGCNIDTRTFFKDFFDFFQKQHYKLYRIAPSGYFLPIEFYRETYEQFRTTNFLAILKDC